MMVDWRWLIDEGDWGINQEFNNETIA